MATGNVVINFYHTSFMRGQVDVSSNVRKHLARLRKTATVQVSPFMPRSEFTMPFYCGRTTFSGDLSWYNYAEINFPDEVNGSLQTLYYFVEADMDAPENTDDCRVMRFYLDAWACYTSVVSRPERSVLLYTPGGTLVRGHDEGNVQGLAAIIPPSNALSIGAADDIGSTDLPVEIVGWDRYVEADERQQLIIVAVVEEAIPLQAPALRMFTLGTPLDTPTDEGEEIYGSILSIEGEPYPEVDDISLYATRLLNLLTPGLYHETIEPDPVAPRPFGALSVKRLYIVPRAIFDGRTDRYSRQVTSMRGDDDVGGVRCLVCLGDDTEQVAFTSTFEMVVPPSPDRVYTWGNTAQHLTFPPSSSERIARAFFLLRPFTGTVSAYLTDGLTEVEISDSLVLPLSAIEDAQAKETAGIKDTLAAIAVAGGIVGGIASGNVTSIASGVIGAANLVADISTRTYAAQRQTIGAAYRNVCANVQDSREVVGAFRLEVYAPANARSMRAAFTRYGWDGDRPMDEILLPAPYEYFQFAPGVMPFKTYPGTQDTPGYYDRFPYMRGEIAAMLEQGVRIWNDEIRTTYLQYEIQ